MILLKLHSCYSQIIAHLLVSAILDYRMSGKDYRYDDIIQVSVLVTYLRFVLPRVVFILYIVST